MSLPQSLTIHTGYPVAGPYSKVISHNSILYLSGIIPLDESGKYLVSTDISAQAHRVFDILEQLLTESGSSVRHCIEVTVYLSSMDTFGIMNEIYKEFFATHCTDGYLPARSTLQTGLYPGTHIEIQVKAARPS